MLVSILVTLRIPVTFAVWFAFFVLFKDLHACQELIERTVDKEGVRDTWNE